MPNCHKPAAEWVNVEERLPEAYKPVLAYAKSTTISGETITMVGACSKGVLVSSK